MIDIKTRFDRENKIVFVYVFKCSRGDIFILEKCANVRTLGGDARFFSSKEKKKVKVLPAKGRTKDERSSHPTSGKTRKPYTYDKLKCISRSSEFRDIQNWQT